jgi:hypothetical protein
MSVSYSKITGNRLTTASTRPIVSNWKTRVLTLYRWNCLTGSASPIFRSRNPQNQKPFSQKTTHYPRPGLNPARA